jgi:hypothetical protein
LYKIFFELLSNSEMHLCVHSKLCTFIELLSFYKQMTPIAFRVISNELNLTLFLFFTLHVRCKLFFFGMWTFAIIFNIWSTFNDLHSKIFISHAQSVLCTCKIANEFEKDNFFVLNYFFKFPGNDAINWVNSCCLLIFKM